MLFVKVVACKSGQFDFVLLTISRPPPVKIGGLGRIGKLKKPHPGTIFATYLSYLPYLSYHSTPHAKNKTNKLLGCNSNDINMLEFTE